MNHTEERLRAATRAAARTVPDGSAPPLLLPGPAEPGPVRPLRRRPGWRRAVTPLAAAAAVLSVVGTSVALTHLHGRPGGSTTAGGASLASVPPFFVYLNGFSGTGETTEAIVRSTVTGRIIARVRPPHPYTVFDKVTATGTDDRHFLLMAQRFRPETGPDGTANQNFDNRTPGAFFTLTIEPGGASARLAPLPAVTVGHAVDVAAMAGSPDGRKLALVMHRFRASSIRVVTLPSGEARTWPWTAPGWVGEDKPAWQVLSWQDDSRTLAFQAHTGRSGGTLEVRLLDTSVPTDSSLEKNSARTVLRLANVHTSVSTGNILVSGDGRLLAGVVQTTAEPPSGRVLALSGVREYSTRTGQLLRVLHSQRLTLKNDTFGMVLWVSSDGGSMVAMLPPHGTGQRVGGEIQPVLGVLTGNQFTPMPFASPLANEFAW